MRITDQYFWNAMFLVLFVVLVITGSIILETEAYRDFEDLTVIDLVLMTLATFRLVRLFVYDKITAFFREQFYDAHIQETKVRLVKPPRGPRRTLADLISCPWCFGAWAGATVVFFYLLTPLALFPILFLAIAGVASLIQVTANLIGWKAEELRRNVEGN